MKIEQIESFLMVAKHMNITKAAEAMYISQSTVSRQIASLEKEIGHPLFFRLKKNLQLTAVGVQLLGEFTKIYDQYSEAILRLKADQSEIVDTLRFGYLIGTRLPASTVSAFRAFSAQYPHIDVIFQQMELPSLLEEIKNGALDLAVFPQIDSYGASDLSSRTIETGALRMVFPSEIRSKPFSIEFFRNLDGRDVFVVNELQYPCIYIAGKELCDHMERSRLVVLSNISTLLQRLHTDQCVAVLGPDFDQPLPEGATSVELNPDRGVPRTLVWRKANQSNSLLLALGFFAKGIE